MLAASRWPPRPRAESSYDSAALDRVERRFWREIWESVPAEVAAEHGIELREFGPVQATVVAALRQVGMLNLVLGAAEPGAVGAAISRPRSPGREDAASTPYVPVTPGLPGSRRGGGWLRGDRLRARLRLDEVRPRPPPAALPGARRGRGRRGDDAGEEPFGTIAALGFGLPAWGAELFAHLPGRDGWRCYVARVDGEAQAAGRW